MVATIPCFATAPYSEQLAFLTGKAAMNHEAISPELWAKLLRNAVGIVPFADLKEHTQSLRQILTPERHGDKRRASGPMLRHALQEAAFASTIGFFSCSENVLMPDAYEKAPRKEPAEGELGSPGLAEIQDSILVIPVFGKKNYRNTERHFLRVDTIWSPQVREDDSRWPEFWYELSAITITDLDDAGLGEFAIRPNLHSSNKAMQVLWHLERGVSTWRDDLSSQTRHATQAMYALRSMYRNAGGVDLWG